MIIMMNMDRTGRGHHYQNMIRLVDIVMNTGITITHRINGIIMTIMINLIITIERSIEQKKGVCIL